MRKTNYLQIVTFDLQRAAGPYRRAMNGSHGVAPWLNVASVWSRQRIGLISADEPG
jgi:hypothetical protein